MYGSAVLSEKNTASFPQGGSIDLYPKGEVMSKLFERLDNKKVKGLEVLSDFIAIYCRENHRGRTKDIFPVKDDRLLNSLGNKELVLCEDCCRLLNHGMAKLILCPYDPKPKCKKCQTQCYAPGYREKIREVMRFSALYLIKHGRMHLILHYLF